MTQTVAPPSQTLTSYDLLKTLAVILMIVDHVGAFFYPQELWFRVVGRYCVPMWFFLIGYARSRDIGIHIWAAGTLVAAARYLIQHRIWSLTILFNILFIRMVLDTYMRWVLKHPLIFWAAALLLAILAVPTNLLTEYGTLGLILAVFGYIVRHFSDDPRKRITLIFPYTIFCVLVFTLIQSVLFQFSVFQSMATFLGSATVLVSLYSFRPMVFPGLTRALSWTLAPLVRFMGRYTLAVYVVHFILFMAFAAYRQAYG